MEQIGQRIRQLRRAQGWKQDDLAARIMSSRAYVAQLEIGHRKPGRDTMLKLATAFGISVETLLNPQEQKETAPTAA